MMMEAAAAAASDHGAHFCAPPVHTEGMRPRLSSATLITGSLERETPRGLAQGCVPAESLLMQSEEKSTRSPAHGTTGVRVRKRGESCG